MQISRLVPSILTISSFVTGVVLDSTQIAQGASLFSDGSIAVEPLSDLNFNLLLPEAEQAKVILTVLAQNSPSKNVSSGKIAITSSTSSPLKVKENISEENNNLSPQYLLTKLGEIQWFWKRVRTVRLKTLPQTTGSDINEGIYSSSSSQPDSSFSNFENPFSEKTAVFDSPFSEKPSVSVNPSLAKTSISDNPFITGDSRFLADSFSPIQIGIKDYSPQIAQGRGISRRGGVSSPVQQLSRTNQDVEFDLIPKEILRARLNTAYQTSLSGAVGDLDSKFVLQIKTEFRLLPDPILLSVSNLELEDFGTSKLTEIREMSIYTVQSKLDKQARKNTKAIQDKLAARDKRRYARFRKNNNVLNSGIASGSLNQALSASAQPSLNPIQSGVSSSSVNSSLSPVSYSSLNRPSVKLSNSEVSPLPRPLLSTPNLSPQPLRTLPKGF